MLVKLENMISAFCQTRMATERSPLSPQSLQLREHTSRVCSGGARLIDTRLGVCGTSNGLDNRSGVLFSDGVRATSALSGFERGLTPRLLVWLLSTYVIAFPISSQWSSLHVPVGGGM